MIFRLNISLDTLSVGCWIHKINPPKNQIYPKKHPRNLASFKKLRG